MARFLGLPRRKFLKQYAKQVGPDQWWLLDQDNPDQWCIFLFRDKEGLFGCRVNDAKPDQCRSFPAGWRNPGSLRTCAGLRTLVARLRERAEASSPEG
jgi:Fe-S-cluster containining protein